MTLTEVTPEQTEGNSYSSNDVPLFELNNISKRYPGAAALSNLDFTLQAGEVHVVFGENGAGKSTLISILSGAQKPTSGTIKFQGTPVSFSTVSDARQLGVSAVFQEFSLIPTMTVADNLMLGSEPLKGPLLDKKTLEEEADSILAELGFPIRANQLVERLSRAQQQMVEISKAFRSDLKVLIFDEPTASLTEAEALKLFKLIEQAKSRQIGIVYITHRLSEIYRLADRVTILRDGCFAGLLEKENVSEKKLLNMMTGRVIDEIFPNITHQPGEVALRTEGLTASSRAVIDASFEVHKGEIVGFAGLVGSGKSEAARACFGVEPLDAGSVYLADQDCTGDSARKMLKRGMFYVSADRKTDGLVMARGARENISLSSLRLPKFSRTAFLRRASEKNETSTVAKRVELQPFDLERPVEHFSGGNQQKVLLARALVRDVDVFVFDEPTVGVDVGTRVAIYQLLAELCEQGAAVLLISSDLPEILNLTHRVYVFHRGHIVDEVKGSDINEENILKGFMDRDETEAC